MAQLSTAQASIALDETLQPRHAQRQQMLKTNEWNKNDEVRPGDAVEPRALCAWPDRHPSDSCRSRRTCRHRNVATAACSPLEIDRDWPLSTHRTTQTTTTTTTNRFTDSQILSIRATAVEASMYFFCHFATRAQPSRTTHARSCNRTLARPLPRRRRPLPSLVDARSSSFAWERPHPRRKAMSSGSAGRQESPPRTTRRARSVA